MGWIQDREELQGHVVRLEAYMDDPGLSADARVTGLAAIVNAKATLHATDVVTSYTGIIGADVTGPLGEALRGFGEKAEQLTAALQQMPRR